MSKITKSAAGECPARTGCGRDFPGRPCRRPSDWIRARAFCAVWLLAANVCAGDFGAERTFSFNGFGTLGAVYNSDDNVEFVRSLRQPSGPKGEWSTEPDSILGVQLNARLSPQWEGVLQLVSHYSYSSDYDPKVAWAFIKYSPTPDLEWRVGRIGYDAYMLSDSSNVGYSYLTVRQPIEYFGTAALAHIDGGDVVYKKSLGRGLFSAKLFAGRADEEFHVGANDQYDLRDSEVVGVNLHYRQEPWHLRASVADTELEHELPTLEPLLQALNGTGSPALMALSDDLKLEGAQVLNWNAGVVYERGPIQAQLLYNKRQTDTLTFSDGTAVYGLLAYRIGLWTPYVGLVDADGDRPARDTGLPAGHPLNAGISQVFRESLFEQRTTLIGVRYDFMPTADIKVQLEHLEAADRFSSFMRTTDPGWDGNATIFSVTLDFIFSARSAH